MNNTELQAVIERAWEDRATLDASNTAVAAAVEAAIELLDSGAARVAEPTASGWQVNDWLKKAVLLYFRLHDNLPLASGPLVGYDKVPLKYDGWTAERFKAQGARVVPPASVRRGAYIAPGAILTPMVEEAFREVNPADPKAAEAEYAQRNPTRRLGQLEEKIAERLEEQAEQEITEQEAAGQPEAGKPESRKSEAGKQAGA